MDFNTISRLALALACPVGMGLMMWWMGKGMHRNPTQPHSPAESADTRLAALRAQREALEAEIAETTRLADLEAKRDALKAGLTLAMDAPPSSRIP